MFYVNGNDVAAWLPDGKGFVFAGAAPGQGLRYYAQSFDGSAPRPITPEGIRFERLSPVVLSRDAKFLAALDVSGPDATHLLRLWQRVQDSTRDLATRRTIRATADAPG